MYCSCFLTCIKVYHPYKCNCSKSEYIALQCYRINLVAPKCQCVFSYYQSIVSTDCKSSLVHVFLALLLIFSSSETGENLQKARKVVFLGWKTSLLIYHRIWPVFPQWNIEFKSHFVPDLYLKLLKIQWQERYIKIC